mmetsp:Transcript_12392/g.30426  ORF Transcript_12392/g.30426 Transcript_12392/m.30426 type:complete len:213 (-) Transcript_12392:637-1275(-)
MLTVEALGQLLEEGLHDFLELLCLCQLEDLLELAQEQDLLLAVCDWPVLEQRLEHWFCELGVLLHELGDAVRQLLVVHRHAFGLVQRHKRSLEEHLVLLLQGQREPVDDGPQYLQQLSHPIVPLRLKDEAVEHVVDGLADEGPVHHELAIDAMQDGLEVVTLPWVLGVEELQQLEDKLLIDVLLGHLGICVIGDHIPQQELVDDLQVGPRRI